MISEEPVSIAGKIADEPGFIGQDGINLVATIVGKMRHLWTPTTGQSDKGIDGYIDLCRNADGKRVSTNFIIQVQSKATDSAWPQEDEHGFVFRVEERDLKHWMAAVNPVILIVSRPRTSEAYWVPIKDYFATLEAKKTRAIYFKKRLHRFDENSNLSLEQLAVPARAALGIQPQLKHESIDTNLLPLLKYPNTIYFAKTRFRKGNALRDRAREIGDYPGRSWFLKRGKVYSFSSFKESPWPKLIGKTGKGDFPTKRWADSTYDDDKKDFVRILNEALAKFLAGRDLIRLRLKRDQILYYFAPDETNIERSATWGDSDRPRGVVQKVMAKKEPSRVLCYRHLALIPRFAKFGHRWLLVIEPTYHFTLDGKQIYPLREDYLAGMKRLEKHLAVRNNVRFWAHWLTYQDLINPRKENLVFGSPETFGSEYGINDNDWLSKADAEEAETLGVGISEDGKTLAVEGNQLVLI